MINEADKSISIIWSLKDVLDCAEDMEVVVSKKEAWDVLKRIHNHHDCRFGITWDCVEREITDLIERRK